MNVVTNLLSSRKVALALIALVVAIADKYGMHLDPDVIDGLLNVFMVAIGGFAAEDVAAKWRSGSAKPPPPPTPA